MNDACYCSTTDKIYGTSGPYVVQCNAATGAREDYVRVASPVMGDIRICYHSATDSLYAATIWQPSLQWFDGTQTYLNRNIFPISPALVVGARINMDAFYDNAPPYGGFQWIGSAGIYLYVVTAEASSPSAYNVLKVNPTNIADRSASTIGPRFRPEQGALSPTQIAIPGPTLLANNSQIQFALLSWNLTGDWDRMYVVPHNPCAVEWNPATAKFYAVCGDTNLLRIDTLTPFPGTFTALNLGAVEATADPCRIRCSPFDSKLYLPCMTSNTVIVWDINTDTGEAKTGFENPCDIVFTSNKIWAVQNSAIGLREIT